MTREAQSIRNEIVSAELEHYRKILPDSSPHCFENLSYDPVAILGTAAIRVTAAVPDGR